MQVVGQFSRYTGHVLKNVGGVYETFKSIEQPGDVYEATPKAIQKTAVAYLNKEVFETPNWLFDKNILNKIASPVANERVQTIQVNALNGLLDGARLYRMVIAGNRYGVANTYGIDEMIDDVKKGVWSELSSHKPIDAYRRNLQKAYADKLISLLNPNVITAITGLTSSGVQITTTETKNTDVTSVARGQLKALQAEINAAIPGTGDRMSKYHLQDVSERIKRALDPKQ